MLQKILGKKNKCNLHFTYDNNNNNKKKNNNNNNAFITRSSMTVQERYIQYTNL